MQWQEAVKIARELRHWFHQNPELTWEEEQTAERIRQCLTDWGIEWRACAKYGTVGIIAPNAKAEHQGKNIALRADMDALPILEKTSVDFASKTPGKMHACGHDGHMAALLGTAFWLKLHEEQLTNTVTLLFQPAEEGGHGAEKMVEEGALEGVDEVYGWHNWPALPFGTAVCPDGAVMSGNGSFEIVVHGLGGHASQPEACRDPLLAASAITLNLQQIVSRRLPPQAAVVISVTQFSSDSNISTIIPQTVKLGGSIRLSDPKWRPQIAELIQQVAEDTAKSYGVNALVEVSSRYEATINDPETAEKYRAVLQQELGENFNETELMIPIMASEDFSYYLQEIPGAFALIGMSENDGESYHLACHNPGYEFNDRLLETVMKTFLKVVGLNPA